MVQISSGATKLREGGEGSPAGAFPFKNEVPTVSVKAPSVNFPEGDPPIGKERGTLGVGTGPTPPPQMPSTSEVTKAKKIPVLKPPKKEDNPKLKRQPQQKRKVTVQTTKITTMFPKKNEIRRQPEDNISPSIRLVQRDRDGKSVHENGQIQSFTEIRNNIYFNNLPNKPDLAQVTKDKKQLSLDRELGSENSSQNVPNLSENYADHSQ